MALFIFKKVRSNLQEILRIFINSMDKVVVDKPNRRKVIKKKKKNNLKAITAIYNLIHFIYSRQL